MRRARGTFVLAVLALLGVSGCLATKGDIRLMQDEFRSSRTAMSASEVAQKAHADSIARAASVTAARAFAEQQSMIRGLSDTVRILRGELAAVQKTVREVRDSVRDQGVLVAQTRFLIQDLSSSGRSLATKVEQLQQVMAQRDQATAERDSLQAILNGGRSDSTGVIGAGTPKSCGQGIPGPNTLREQGVLSLSQGARSAARRSFQLLIDSCPNDPLVPESYMYIGQSFTDERNPTAADSVYQLVVKQFPKTPSAGLALYRQAVIADGRNDPARARQLYQKVVSDYPNSEPYRLACDKLNHKSC